MAHCPNCGIGLQNNATSCTSCGAEFGPASARRPVEGAPPRQANPHRLQHTILAAISLVAVVAMFSWGYLVEQKKTELLKQAEEARRKELSIPVIGEGGVSVRVVAECSNDEFGQEYKVEKIARDGEILVVLVAATDACGLLRPVQPRADVAGNTVTLGWAWQHPKGVPMAACLCTRHLEFRVPGIPPGEPNIAVPEIVQTID
jgi:hypothetical protein